MRAILAGEATPSQIAAFAMALRVKGETAAEIAAFAAAVRETIPGLPLPAPLVAEDLLDTCGTGGDGAGTFNVSTAVALVAVGAGARVAKHGNRSVSSRSGSADVFEALGVAVEEAPAVAAERLAATGFAFLYAPAYHPAFRHAAGPRRELGVRTVFNVLGPLSNPALAGRRLLGVYDDRWVRCLAEALATLGARAACVVHSEDGLDELSVFAPAHVAWLERGAIREERLDPRAFGLAHMDRSAVGAAGAAESARRIESVLAGESGAARDLVVWNTAAALVVAGIARDLEVGIALSRASIDEGRARATLASIRAFRPSVRTT
jgi:anthranilate phosphoribosyltransferase